MEVTYINLSLDHGLYQVKSTLVNYLTAKHVLSLYEENIACLALLFRGTNEINTQFCMFRPWRRTEGEETQLQSFLNSTLAGDQRDLFSSKSAGEGRNCILEHAMKPQRESRGVATFSI